MTDWTAERLDALPDATVIELDRHRWLQVAPGWWRAMFSVGVLASSIELLEDADNPGSIRVVSVPVDALLTVGHDYPDQNLDDKMMRGFYDGFMRAAIGHVTGEQP